LYSAAANLGEFGCTPALAVALLEESALDSGLPPKDIRRGIECGLAAVASPVIEDSTPTPMESTHQDAGKSPQGRLDDSTIENRPQAATSDSGGLGGQTCQQLTGATDSPPPAELQAALARLWGSTPAAAVQSPLPKDQGTALPQHFPGNVQTPLPPLPESLAPLPPGAVGSGALDKPCKCGSREFVDVGISKGRSRRDCRKCGRFLGWGQWYEKGGAA
jgi:hypothetical protein